MTRRRIPKRESIKRIIGKVLELEKSPRSYLSVTYVNGLRIRSLNKEYRGEDSPTDVLAFSIEARRPRAGEDRFLGEIIISLDAAERQAKYFNTTKDEELKLYLIHGILHLLGYSDKRGPGLRKIKKREEELFKKI